MSLKIEIGLDQNLKELVSTIKSKGKSRGRLVWIDFLNISMKIDNFCEKGIIAAEKNICN